MVGRNSAPDHRLRNSTPADANFRSVIWGNAHDQTIWESVVSYTNSDGQVSDGCLERSRIISKYLSFECRFSRLRVAREYFLKFTQTNCFPQRLIFYVGCGIFWLFISYSNGCHKLFPSVPSPFNPSLGLHHIWYKIVRSMCTLKNIP